MIYGTLDLKTEERNAWQRGDYRMAEVLALAIDAQADAGARNALDAIHDEITTANWRTGTKAELRALIERILTFIHERD